MLVLVYINCTIRCKFMEFKYIADNFDCNWCRHMSPKPFNQSLRNGAGVKGCKLGQGSSWYKWYTPPDCDCWHIPGIWQSHFGGAAFLGNQWGRGHLVADYYKKPYNRLGTLVLACAGARVGSVLQTTHSIHPSSITQTWKFLNNI